MCQYENTSNRDFLIDRHSERDNVWLVGDGSGHGLKHGPAVGEYVAARIVEGGPVESRFSLATREKVQEAGGVLTRRGPAAVPFPTRALEHRTAAGATTFSSGSI